MADPSSEFLGGTLYACSPKNELIRIRQQHLSQTYPEITLIPDPEAPARVTKALGKLYAALRAIGVSGERAWSLVRKIAFDSMPKLR
jgi:hypothetical protein